MAILNFQVDSIGQSGVVPKMIYLQTNNTISEIVGTPGYLNSLVAQGNTLSSMDMALVTTTDSPNTELFNVAHSGGNWSLTQYGAPPALNAWLLTGNTDATMASFLGNQNAVPLEIGTNGLPTLSIASDGSVVWSGQGPGLFWTLAAGLGQRFSLITMIAESELTLDSISQIDLGVTNADIINIGRSAATTTLTGPNINIPSLANSVTANAVYYNSVTGLLTYGAAGGGGSGWNLTGTNSGAGLKFGTNSADGIDFQVNSINFLTVSSALAMVLAPAGVPSLTIGNASCDLQGNFGNVLLKVNGINFLGVNGSSVMFIGDSAGGNITIEASKLFLANCASSATSDIVYFDSGTGQLSFGPSSSLDGVFLIGGQNFFSDYFLGSLNNVTLDIGTGGVTLISMDAGQNVDISSPGVINVGLLHATEVHIGNATAGTKTYILADDFQLEASGPRFDTLFGSAGIVGIGNINAQHLTLGNTGTAWLSRGTTWTGIYSSDIDIESTTDIFFQASSSGPVFANFELDGAAGVVSIFASSGMRIDGGTLDINTLTTSAVTISASSGTINLSASTINAANLSSGTASNVLYWNSSTKQVTQGAAPAAALSWSTVSGTSQTMVARNAYVSGNVALITFTLPVTAAVGDEFMVQGNSAGGWKIVYNSGQNIQVGNVSSTVTTGDVSSSNRYDVIKLVCVVADTSFNAEFLVGSLSIT